MGFNLCISLFYILFYSIILSLYNSNPIEISCFIFTLLSKASLLYGYKLKKKDSYLLKRKRIKIVLSLIQTFIIIYTSILIYTHTAFLNIQFTWFELVIYQILQSVSTMIDIICFITLLNDDNWNTHYISQV